MWKKTHKDERGVWNDYVNEETGEHSLKEHKPKIVWKGCEQGKHEFEINGRELRCVKCGFTTSFVLGRDNKWLKTQGLI